MQQKKREKNLHGLNKMPFLGNINFQIFKASKAYGCSQQIIIMALRNRISFQFILINSLAIYSDRIDCDENSN